MLTVPICKAERRDLHPHTRVLLSQPSCSAGLRCGQVPEDCTVLRRAAALGCFPEIKLHLHKGQRLCCQQQRLKGTGGCCIPEKQPQHSDAAGPCPSPAAYAIRGNRAFKLKVLGLLFPSLRWFLLLQQRGRDGLEGLSPALCWVLPCKTIWGAGKDRIVPGRAASGEGRCLCCSSIIKQGWELAPPAPSCHGCPLQLLGWKALGGRQWNAPWAHLGTHREPCPFAAAPKGPRVAGIPLPEAVPQQQPVRSVHSSGFDSSSHSGREPCERCQECTLAMGVTVPLTSIPSRPLVSMGGAFVNPSPGGFTGTKEVGRCLPWAGAAGRPWAALPVPEVPLALPETS